MKTILINFILALLLAGNITTTEQAPNQQPVSTLSAHETGVVMGDSVAEGYPLHGRLNEKEQTVDWDHKDQPGQIAYELNELTDITWYNNAIHGQTTEKIWNRWCRDVLDNGCDPGDGIGTDTLKEKPEYVIVSSGINDIYKGVDLETTKKNITSMVESAKENDIKIIVYTVYLFDEQDAATVQKRVDLNNWIVENVPKLGGYVYRYDQFAEAHYAEKAKYYTDNVHPNVEGHKLIAKELYDQFDFLH